MRRALVLLTVLGLMLLAGAALAESGSENYLDKFSSVSYSGSDGSLHWAGPWKEVGENDGPGSGRVRVEGSGCSGQCLTIEASGLLTTGRGAYRLADTADFSHSSLSYKVGFNGGDPLLGLVTATLTVDATSNGGGSWSRIDSVVLGSEDDEDQRSVSVTGFASDDFGVRFLVTGSLGAEVLIDNVEVAGEIPPPPTTTTTSTTTTTTSATTTTTLITLPPPTLPKLSTTTTTTTKTTTTTTTPISSTTTTADLEANGSTTTIDPGETTTTVVAGVGGDDDDPGGGGDGGGLQSGLLQTSIGVGSDVPRGLFGSTPEVLSFEVAPGYANAVELIEASWVWVLGLALMIAAALIRGIDRRLDHEPAPDSEV